MLQLVLQQKRMEHMGGMVCVALRKAGKTTACVIHTSQASGLFWRRDFLSKPSLAPHQDNKPFEPDDYGIIAIDADTGWVGSLQGYCTLASIHPKTLKDDKETATDVAKASAGKTLVLQTFCEPKQGGKAFHHPTPFALAAGKTTATALREALRRAEAQAKDELQALDLVDVGIMARVQQKLTPGWTIEHFNESSDSGWQGFCEQLIKRNWLPTLEELMQWEKHLVYKRQNGEGVSVDGCKPLRAHFLEQQLEEKLDVPVSPKGPARHRM